MILNATNAALIITQGSGDSVTIEVGKGSIVLADGAGIGASVTDFTAAVQNVTDLSSPFNVGATSVTTSGAELNLLDGSGAGTIANSKAVIYGSSGEVNATTLQIAGTSITATAAELNYVDGVTSAIQTQIDAKQPLGTVTVTVANPGSGNKYYIDGSSQQTVEIKPSVTYRFDQSDSSNSGHPLRFSTTSNGTHAGGSEFTTGVTTAGTPGSAGAYTQVKLEQDAPIVLYYYCTNHSGMGGKAVIRMSDLTVSRALISDSGGDIAVSAVTATELGYLDGVTSAIQTQIDSKQGTLSLTANRALISDSGGSVSVSPVTNTEVGYLDGVTSAIQTQIDSKINGSSLNASNLSSGTVPDARLLGANPILNGLVVSSSGSPATSSNDIYSAGDITAAVALNTNKIENIGSNDLHLDSSQDVILDTAGGGNVEFRSGGSVASGKINANTSSQLLFKAGTNGDANQLLLQSSGVNVHQGLRVGDTQAATDNDIYAVADIEAGADLKAGGEIKLTGGAQDWTFEVDGSNRLVIQYNGTSLARIDTSGNLVVAGDVTSFGSL
jgi:hypothetical protein